MASWLLMPPIRAPHVNRSVFHLSPKHPSQKGTKYPYSKSRVSKVGITIMV